MKINGVPKTWEYCVQIRQKFLVMVLIGGLFLFSYPSLVLGEPSKKGQKQNEAKQIKSQIGQIDHELDQAVERYNQSNIELENIRAESRVTSQKIEKASQDLENQKSILGARVRNIYKHGDVPFIETVFTTKTFEQFLCTIDRLQDIATQDAKILRDIEQLKQEIEEKKAQLVEQEKNQQVACKELASQKSEISQKLDERRNALVGVEDEIAALEREEQAEAERLRAQVEREQKNVQTVKKAPQPQVSRGSDRLPAPKSGVVGVAMQQLGKPYQWAAAGPSSFDCSGLVMYCYAQVGVSLPHSAAAQYGSGAHVSRDQLQPGDLVFFSHGGGGIAHVGMYVGGDSYIHAPRTGDVVKISSLSARGPGYVGGVRP